MLGGIKHMDPLVIIGVFFGSVVTWVVCKYFYDAQRNRYLIETAEQMKRGNETQQRFYAMTASVYVEAIRYLESGDSEGAKRDLASSVAIFYRSFSDQTLSGSGLQSDSWIEAQKREIMLLAKTSKVLRAALEEKPDKTPAAS